jgi:hypothetical protein
VAQEIKDKSEANPTASGYFVLVNSADTPRPLWVKNGELWWGRDKPYERFSEADYCLLRLDFPKERSVAELAFSKVWNKIKELVWHGEIAKAEATLLDLGRQLAVSPDLTTVHRYQLIALYKVNLEREIELWNSTRQPTRRVHKGSGDARGGRVAIQTMLTHLPENSGVRRNVALLVSQWDSLVDVYDKQNRELTDDVLRAQLATLEGSDWTPQTPEELLQALTLSAIR